MPKVSRFFEPLLLACLLNLLVVLAAWFWTESPLREVLQAWSEGFGSLMGFAMQMVLMLVLGHVLASAPGVYRLLTWLARWLSRQRGTAFWIVLLTAAISWLHWGLGLVAGALIAREVAAVDKVVDSAHLLRYTAAAYAGFIVWHGGWSGSAPLVVATPGHSWEAALGVIPVQATILSPLNLSLLLGVTVVAALTVQWLPIRVSTSRSAEPAQPPPPAAPEPPSWRWDYALPTGLAISGITTGLLLLGAQSLNLNSVILLLFGLGLSLHSHSAAFQGAVKTGLGDTAGVVVQFPLYGAIMGVMQASGLAVMLAQSLLQVTSSQLFLPLVFLSAGALNVLVPSGGGQWAVQAPVLIPVAQQMGADLGQLVVAFAWGDAWTNLIQPFWALPLLAITRVEPWPLLKISSWVCVSTGLIACGILYGLA